MTIVKESAKLLQNAVFPIKMIAENLKTGEKFSVLSTGVIDTSNNSTSMKVLYTDGDKLYTMSAGEFDDKHTIIIPT
jgi:translation elongation factor P/translation initiation factor 5A